MYRKNVLMINLPKDAQERKACPVWSGFMKYFPNAMIAVSRLSQMGNDQHHPGTPLHWDKDKSKDDMDALMRHALEGHHEAVAWRAMANLERELLNGYKAKSWEKKP